MFRGKSQKRMLKGQALHGGICAKLFLNHTN